MPEQTPSSPNAAPRTKRRRLSLRLRPFLRRDLKPRLVSAAVAAGLVGGLSWLGVSALTQMDTEAARDLRVRMAIEHEWDYCDGPGQPACAFDDRAQEDVDRAYAEEQRIRVAVADELRRRVDAAISNLDRAHDLVGSDRVDLHSGVLGDNLELSDLLLQKIDLRPLVSEADSVARTNSLERAAYRVRVQDGKIKQGGKEALLKEIALQREGLVGERVKLDRILERDGDTRVSEATSDRQALWAELFNSDPYGNGGEIAGWLLPAGGAGELSGTLAHLSRSDTDTLAAAIFDPQAAVWHGTFDRTADLSTPIAKASVRYASPVASERRWQLFGATLLGFAALFFIVVGPVATATHTAREREAGTLPVLRMTGLSAGDLALAMALGPNVFATVAGGLLLLLGVLALAFTAGLGALVVPLAAMLLLGVTTHLTAIGLGDALGHRVNALMVGALMAFGIVGPGLFGTALATAPIASAGLLFGPLPPVFTGITELTGLPHTEGAMFAFDAGFGQTILGYSLLIQGLLAGICLLSWRRRVEQAWTPLFRPAEGVALAIASIGCSGLTLLDLSERLNTQSFDSLNLVTFLASSFLLPLLGWLLVASLRRPARASAVADHVESRRAFWRFQGVLGLTAAIVGIAYHFVMNRSGLGAEPSELMWATLTQVVLIAETAIGTLLWASRKREGKHRRFMLGGALLLLQTVFAALIYRLEVDFVASFHAAGKPFLMGMDASPYWIGLMILLWGAGLGLILAALLRDRDRVAEEKRARESQLEEDADEEGRHRWLH
ncbi:MAG: hypothetical protein R3A79_20285 [Nannocystaceae bacterium]